jgi:hypothetical protein
MNIKSANWQDVLIPSLLDIDWRCQHSKQISGGIGFKVLRQHSYKTLYIW